MPALNMREASRHSLDRRSQRSATRMDASTVPTLHVKRSMKQYGSFGYRFIAPFMLLFAAFALAPLCYAFYTSLYVSRLVGGTKFAGLLNYQSVVSDPAFWAGVERVLEFGAVVVPLTLLIAVAVAVSMDLGLVGADGFFRVLYFVPFAVPGVVATIMWGYMYEPSFGPFADIAHQLGMEPPAFLSAAGLLPSMGNIVVWATTGYNVILMYTGLKAVPHELSEAAIIDGASTLGLIRHVKLPLIRPVIMLGALLGVIGSLQLFTEPEILSSLAPAVTSSYTPNLYAYNTAFTGQEFNLAGAMAFLIAGAVIVLATGAVFTRRLAKKTGYSLSGAQGGNVHP